jgi:electron transport complex protein RnfB
MGPETDIYRELQKHLDAMPIGYPATSTGVELRLLKSLFTPEQARIALGLDYKFRSVEQIHDQLQDSTLSVQELESRLEEMANKGNTFAKTQDGVKLFASMPFVVGMLESQVHGLTIGLIKDVDEYFREKYAAEYLGSKAPQMRIIPIEKSITAGHRIGTYEELRSLIENAGDRIRVGECMCRKSMQMVGRPCEQTTRKETCMAFRDYADVLARTGWGRTITKEEAIEIALQNEEDGLVLQPSNDQEGQFICSCCSDCCGILKMAKMAPKPAEDVASNYYAQVDAHLCTECGTCVDRCPMNAIEMQDSSAEVNRDRCIGCGVCIPTCPTEAIHLEHKERVRVPPKDREALLETIMEGKKLRHA